MYDNDNILRPAGKDGSTAYLCADNAQPMARGQPCRDIFPSLVKKVGTGYDCATRAPTNPNKGVEHHIHARTHSR